MTRAVPFIIPSTHRKLFWVCWRPLVVVTCIYIFFILTLHRVIPILFRFLFCFSQSCVEMADSPMFISYIVGSFEGESSRLLQRPRFAHNPQSMGTERKRAGLITMCRRDSFGSETRAKTDVTAPLASVI